MLCGIGLGGGIYSGSTCLDTVHAISLHAVVLLLVQMTVGISSYQGLRASPYHMLCHVLWRAIITMLPVVYLLNVCCVVASYAMNIPC